MCRLAYFSPRVAQLRLKDLRHYLAFLEKQQGGHGNGVAILPPEGNPRIVKGVNLNIKHAAWLIWDGARNGCSSVFHTRLASVGQKRDSLCHPFRAGQFFVAHNGTEWDYKVLARYFGEKDAISDTLVFATLYGKKGEEWMRKRDLWPKSGVWICAGKNGGGKIYHCATHGDLEYCPDLDSFSSFFPHDFPFKTFIVKKNVTHEIGQVPEPNYKPLTYYGGHNSHYQTQSGTYKTNGPPAGVPSTQVQGFSHVYCGPEKKDDYVLDASDDEEDTVTISEPSDEDLKALIAKHLEEQERYDEQYASRKSLIAKVREHVTGKGEPYTTEDCCWD